MSFLLSAILLAINLGAGCYFTFANPLKISEQTSTKLNFIIRPKVFLGLGIFFSQFFVLFLFATIVFTPITQLVCNRYLIDNISTSNIDLSAGQNTIIVMCKLTKNNWLGREQSQTLVSELLEAKLQTQIDTDGQAKYYRYNILLLNDRESFPFSRAGYPKLNLEELQSIVLRINNFLKNPIEKNLEVILDETFTGYISVIITVFCGILALLVASPGLFMTCNLDKEANTVKLSRYRWFGTLGKTIFQYSLNEINDVKLERIVILV